ncbi:hypothetical protein FBU59_001112 [Linderina macrospora]|uniref:Uncharacterized protein n=1 Tax=Linderina macrospora TaxID=4868 RepID=A0ACC1JF76_9FUNG|nr:hypothetical protein FBU59_001112 [Linderina macrospora]
MLRRTTQFAQRLGTRGFASLSVHVRYGTLKTTTADLQQHFEQYGSVWDVIPLESHISGRLLQQAVVRFYVGEYTRGTPPTLPPPTQDEIETAKLMVQKAISHGDGSVLNGSKIRVRESYDDSPTQLHEWYENLQLEQDNERSRRRELFPINPFHEPLELGDDYQRGFMIGYSLGLKDGTKQTD